jgi:hypothetical protein
MKKEIIRFLISLAIIHRSGFEQREILQMKLTQKEEDRYKVKRRNKC